MPRKSTHETTDREMAVRPPSERSFAVVWTVVLVLVALWPLWNRELPRWWALGAAAAVALAGWLAPSTLQWPNRAWFQLSLLLGRVVTPVVAALLFYLVFTPIGLLMRLFGHDPLRLRWEPDAKSYWIKRTPPGPPPETMTQQF